MYSLFIRITSVQNRVANVLCVVMSMFFSSAHQASCFISIKQSSRFFQFSISSPVGSIDVLWPYIQTRHVCKNCMVRCKILMALEFCKAGTFYINSCSLPSLKLQLVSLETLQDKMLHFFIQNMYFCSLLSLNYDEYYNTLCKSKI